MADTLDCRGMKCPMPVIETKKRLDALPGDELSVLVDEQVQAQNILRAVTGAGHFAEVQSAGTHFSVRIRKAQATQSSECELMPCEPGAASGDVALLLTSDQIGADAKLGRLLASMLLYTAAEAEVAPQAIVLANTGVRLACEGSAALESMQKLASRGVTILICGTCVDYFRLAADLQVGTVSNMVEIYETLGKAAKVIAP